MDTIAKHILDWLDENASRFTRMSDAIWDHPEVAWHEFRSSRLQVDFLEAENFTIRGNVAGINTAFVAEWGRGSPVFGFLGEYDALAGLSQKNQPEKEPIVEGAAGHGCGHNLLGTGTLASAVAIRHWLEKTERTGTVRYYGCPAEEEVSGKTFMARDGVFHDLDAAFTFHPDKVNYPQKGSAVGLNQLKFRFHGRTAHAGVAPHEGRSALGAVELMNVGVNYLRQHVTEKVRIHHVITDGGRVPNVIPEDAEVWYFVRAHRRQELQEVTDRVRAVAAGAAMMTETEVEERFGGACSSLLNNHVLADLHYEAMQLIGPIQFTDRERKYAARINSAFPKEQARILEYAQVPESWKKRVETVQGDPLVGDNFPAWDLNRISTGSSDVGDVSWITPLCMLRTACLPTAAPGHSWATVAVGANSIGHKGMLHAAKVMAVAAARAYADPGVLSRARAEWEENTRNNPYISPIPDHVQPPNVPSPMRGDHQTNPMKHI